MSSQQYLDPKTGGTLGQILATGATNVAPPERQVLCDTASGAVGVQLPIPASDGTVILISDNSSNAATNNITITPTGGLLIDGAATLVLSVNDADAMLVGEAGVGWTRILPPKNLPFSPTTGIRTPYYRAQDAAEVVPPSSPGGANGDLQYNNAGAFGGTTGFTFNSAGGYINVATGKILNYGTVANAATVGVIRFPVGALSLIASRNAAGTGNLVALAVGAADQLYVGNDNTLANQYNQVVIGAVTQQVGVIGSTTYYTVGGNVLGAYKPITGDAVTAYGVHGLGTQAMADSNQTPSASVFQYGGITTTGALTASRVLTMPLVASDATGFIKAYWNACTGSFAVTVDDGTNPGTMTLPNGTTALGLSHSGGVKQITPQVNAAGLVPVSGGGTNLSALGSALQVLRTNAAATALEYATITSGGWQTVLDLDFAAEASQTINTNGNWTIGGYTWVKANSVADATAMAVTNGTGLVITPVAASDYNGGTMTLPRLSLTLAQLVGADNVLGSAFRITIYISAANALVNYDSTVWGIDSGSNVCGYLGKRGLTTSGAGLTSFLQANSLNVGYVDRTMAIAAANNVVQLEVPSLGGASFQARYGQYSAGFPAMSAMTPYNAYAVTTIDNAGLTGSNASLMLGGQRAGSATAFVTTIARVKVEVRY